MVRDERILIDSQNELHFLTGGSGNNVVILIHGGHKQLQNAEHWRPHFSWLEKQANFFAVDLLGHGESIPGKNDNVERIDVSSQVSALEKLVDHIKSDLGEDVRIIWVGRSYGGRVVLSFAEKRPTDVDGMVLIAPAASANSFKLDSSIVNMPIMLFWAEDDPIIRFTGSKSYIEKFPNAIVCPVGTVLAPGVETWKGHSPELVKYELFKECMEKYMSQIFS